MNVETESAVRGGSIPSGRFNYAGRAYSASSEPPKKTKAQAEYERETSEAFIDGQRFRAGSEGNISGLKRAFKLGKCFFRGFKNYAASIGFVVLCHSLVLLTRV